MSSGSFSVVTPPQQPSLLGTVGRYHNLVLKSLYQCQLAALTNKSSQSAHFLDRSKATRNEVLAEPVNLLLVMLCTPHGSAAHKWPWGAYINFC
jgi:hypothetical protein